MSRFHIKKQPLIAVAGIVWLLAGLNVAILGVRAAIDMRGVAAIIFLRGRRDCHLLRVPPDVFQARQEERAAYL